MKRFNMVSVLLAGIAATATMTALMMVAPTMGAPKMDIAGMLAGFMGVPVAVGWAAHFMIGIVLAGGYALFFAGRRGPAGWIGGALFGFIPWLMAQIIVMPMMGAPLFSGSAALAGASLMGHLVYGAVLGAVYKPLPENVASKLGRAASSTH